MAQAGRGADGIGDEGLGSDEGLARTFATGEEGAHGRGEGTPRPVCVPVRMAGAPQGPPFAPVPDEIARLAPAEWRRM